MTRTPPLREIADGVWDLERTISVAPGFAMPVRTTIVQRGTEVFVHAPLGIDDREAQAIDALGRVTTLVAPNCLHYMFLEKAHERWPDARVYAAPGLEKKLRPGVSFEPLPASGTMAIGDDEIRVARIEGAPGMGEHVFFHPLSKSLVVTDLVFNIHGSASFCMRLLLRCVGAYAKPAQSRAWRFFTKDRAQAAASVREVLTWDVERVVVGHGDVITDDARGELSRALAWMARGAPALLPNGAAS